MSGTPGRRLFIYGSVGLLLFGAVHGLAIINSWRGPSDDAERAVVQAMQSHGQDAGPLRLTMWGAFQTLSVSYTLLLWQVGAMNLLLLGPAISAGKFLPLTILNIVFLLAILVASTCYQLLPPMVFSAALAGFFAASMFRQQGPPDESEVSQPGARP